MNLDKQKIVQILAILVIILALILITLFWEKEHDEMRWKNPFEVNSYLEVDNKILYMLEKENWLKKEEIQLLMETWSGKTLKEILEEKWIEIKFWKRD